eukprot:GHVS01066398.1.p1 GENE.GHVS01066398.1~~GHVS01066398.1.p1  ORF type:complete len:183 (+),score=16.32 GHVS01066398.1:438-986(+)
MMPSNGPRLKLPRKPSLAWLLLYRRSGRCAHLCECPSGIELMLIHPPGGKNSSPKVIQHCWSSLYLDATIIGVALLGDGRGAYRTEALEEFRSFEKLRISFLDHGSNRQAASSFCLCAGSSDLSAQIPAEVFFQRSSRNSSYSERPHGMMRTGGALDALVIDSYYWISAAGRKVLIVYQLLY